MKSGTWTLPVADYDSALRCDPDNADARFNRARIRYRLGRYREAVEDYTAAIGLRPDDVEAINNRGLAYDALGAGMRTLSRITTPRWSCNRISRKC